MASEETNGKIGGSLRREGETLLALFGVLFFLGLGSIGFLDYDEAAYVESARQMHLSGDLLTPRVQGEAFFEKPPLLYWWMIAGFRLFGVEEWGGRLPSAFATLFTALALYGFLRRCGRRDAALPVALVFGLCIQVFLLARTAMTDASLTLLMTAVVALGYLAITRDGPPRWSTIVATGVAAGLAVLAKGPVGLALPAVVLLVFLFLRGRLREGLRRLAPGRVLAVALLVAAPWFAIMIRDHGMAFVEEFFVEQNLMRFLKPQEGHSGPPGYYLVILLVGFFPWVVLLPQAIRRVWPRRGAARDESGGPRPLDREGDLGFFALLWAGVILLFFAVSRTKLPQYIAPAFPPLAVLVALAAVDLLRSPDASHRLRWPVRIVAVLALLLGGSLLALPAGIAILRRSLSPEKQLEHPFLEQSASLPVPFLLLGLGLVAFGVGLVVLRRRPALLARFAVGGMAVLLLGVVWLGPSVDRFMLAPLRSLSVQAGEMTPPDAPVLVVGLRRAPSIAIYARRRTDRLDWNIDERLEQIAASGKPFALVAPRGWCSRLDAIEGLIRIREEGGYVLYSGSP
jgi:4-amino-4-deoxy-L-arabinose transferase-like glycosyltransferase